MNSFFKIVRFKEYLKWIPLRQLLNLVLILLVLRISFKVAATGTVADLRIRFLLGLLLKKLFNIIKLKEANKRPFFLKDLLKLLKNILALNIVVVVYLGVLSSFCNDPGARGPTGHVYCSEVAVFDVL